jgi:NTE family protein
VERKHNTQINTWGVIHLLLKGYPVNTKYYSLGLNLEVNLSNIPFFSNYFGTIVSYTPYQPVPEASTLFQPNFRAANWLGFGLMNVFKPMKKLQVRIEGYFFQPANHITPGEDGQVQESNLFEFRYYILSAAIVFQTRIGPLSINYNIYDDNFPNQSISVNFGYTIFNKSAWD